MMKPAFQRFLFWIRYDGTFFSEMVKCRTKFSLMEFFELCVTHSIGCARSDIRFAAVSRTDKHVHAVRTPVIAHVPQHLFWIDRSEDEKVKLIGKINDLSQIVARSPRSFQLLDFHRVSPDFSPRFNVAYRKYVYRICVPKDYTVFTDRTLAFISEHDHAWIVEPSFDVYKAQKVCHLLQSRTYNFASFFKHTDSHRKQNLEYRDTIRRFHSVRVEAGEPFSFPNDDFEHYNFTFVARSFVREQIRRLISVIVAIACGKQPMRYLHYLLENPDPRHFYRTETCNFNVLPAPPGGLFLTDVVYDPRMFTNPVPKCTHNWDRFEMEEICRKKS